MLFLSSDSVKALKAAQSIDPNQWPGLILSSSTTELRMEGALFLLNGFLTPVPRNPCRLKRTQDIPTTSSKQIPHN